MRILLLTSYFFPDEHIGASRWNRLSKYLLQMGHEIFVVASDNSGNYSIPQVLCSDIIRVNSYASIPDKMLVKVSNAKKNIPIEKKRQNYQTETKDGTTLLYAKAIEFAGKIARFPNVQWWSAGEMVKAGMHFLRKYNIDIIVATHPFPGCLKAAAILSMKTKTPWVADMRDGWSSYYDLEYKPDGFFNRLIAMLERKYLKKASSVVAVNQKLAESLQVNINKTIVIPNSFDNDETHMSETMSRNIKSGHISFSFAGTILPEHSWDIFLKGLAIFLSKNSKVKITINYFGNSFDVLKANAINYGLAENLLSNHGYLSKKHLKQELAKSDFLVVFCFNGPFGATVTTGKIFDYMEAYKPVIVVGRDDSELALLVKTTGIGSIASRPSDIDNLLENYVKDTHGFLDAFQNQRKPIEILKYSSSHTAQVYANLLSQLSRK
ncbi:MAG: glycosyltransferase [Chitinophagaceae bacterium]|nr:glycosyltransferase [Chitinophagaceae bacterium]